MSRWIGSPAWFASTAIALLAVTLPAHAQQVLPVSRVVPTDPKDEHPIDAGLAFVRASLEHVQSSIDDYTALFVKRCRVDGELPERTFARIKVRNPRVKDGRSTPMSVYLQFLKPAATKGREVIWVDGWNEGKMVAHKGGFANLVSLHLDPMGYLAMRGQRRPITDIGIENLLKEIIRIGERDRQYGECDVQFYKNAKVGDTVCTMLQVTHPERREHFDFHIARIYFANDSNIPVRYISWIWPQQPGGEPMLDEEYNYLDVKLNVGLTDQDFDHANPEYQFP